MRALVQRVSRASVTIDGAIVGAIGPGLLVFLGIRSGDNPDSARQLAQKVINLRIFEDDQGKLNLAVHQTGGEMLVVSQFTLYGETRKGNRPSFSEAAPAEIAKPLYDEFVNFCRRAIKVETGVFQAFMRVESVNSGPVTLLCSTDS